MIDTGNESDGQYKTNSKKEKDHMRDSMKGSKGKSVSLTKNESKTLTKVDSFSNLNRSKDNIKNIRAELSGSIVDFNDRIWINTPNTDARMRRLKIFKKENIKVDKFTSNHIEWIKKEYKAVITDEN